MSVAADDSLPVETDAPDESEPRDEAPRKGAGKSDTAFRTISEVAGDLDVPAHVLRFWESKFTQIKPMKRGGGRRYYRPEDVTLLKRIRDLLYNEGYTIRGVQKLLKEGNGKFPEKAALAEAAPASIEVAALAVSGAALDGDVRRQLEAALEELQALKNLLKNIGA